MPGQAIASPLDLKKLLRDVMPCKSAAIRLCERSEGISPTALWKCGATLASRRDEVDARCLAVLKRYGQLH
jgi:hypothetical protein